MLTAHQGITYLEDTSMCLVVAARIGRAGFPQRWRHDLGRVENQLDVHTSRLSADPVRQPSGLARRRGSHAVSHACWCDERGRVRCHTRAAGPSRHP